VARWTAWRTRLEALSRDGDRTARDGFKLMKRFDRRIAAPHHRTG
jgi:hypothetical protein